MSNENDELRRKIAEWIKIQGYPLEMTVATAFQKAGFTVSLSDYYKDIDTGESREIDVSAFRWTDFAESTVLQICWRIECKLAREKPWIIFVSESQPEHFLPLDIAASMICLGFLIKSFKHDDLRAKLMRQPLLQPSYVGHGVTQAFTTGQDVPYKAIMSSAKSSVARILQFDEFNKNQPTKQKQQYWCISFSTVVIEGSLFECFVDSSGESHLREVQSGAVYWKGLSLNHSSLIVYIITKQGLSQFIKQVQEATTILIEIIMEHIRGEMRDTSHIS